MSLLKLSMNSSKSPPPSHMAFCGGPEMVCLLFCARDEVVIRARARGLGLEACSSRLEDERTLPVVRA